MGTRQKSSDASGILVYLLFIALAIVAIIVGLFISGLYVLFQLACRTWIVWSVAAITTFSIEYSLCKQRYRTFVKNGTIYGAFNLHFNEHNLFHARVMKYFLPNDGSFMISFISFLAALAISVCGTYVLYRLNWFNNVVWWYWTDSTNIQPHTSAFLSMAVPCAISILFMICVKPVTIYRWILIGHINSKLRLVNRRFNYNEKIRHSRLRLSEISLLIIPMISSFMDHHKEELLTGRLSVDSLLQKLEHRIDLRVHYIFQHLYGGHFGNHEQETPVPKHRVTTKQEAYKILDLDPGAGTGEIKKKYYEKVQIYHPDKLRDVRPEIRKLAEEETKKINLAKEVLLG